MTLKELCLNNRQTLKVEGLTENYSNSCRLVSGGFYHFSPLLL